MSRCILAEWSSQVSSGYADPKTERAWESDTIVNVFSTTKGMASMAVLHAASHGLFGFDDLVADHWPEFAAGGKGAVTIRRTDPERRTIGQYFNEEIATPLSLDFWIGLPTSIPQDRIARLQANWYRLKMVANISKMPKDFVKGFLNPRSLTARTFGNPAVLGKPARYNEPEMRRLELPAANGHGTARAIATAYGEFAAGGARLRITPDVASEVASAAAEPSGG